MKKQKSSSKQPKKTQYTHKSTPNPLSTLGSLENALAVGSQYHQAGHLQAAHAIYHQILQSYPNHPEALYAIGVISFNLGNQETAIEYFTRVIQLNPRLFEAHFYLGVIFQTQGKLESAARSYENALDLDPNNGSAYYNLAEVLALQENSIAAVEHYQLALKCPKNLFSQGNFAHARKAAEYCVQFGNEQQKLTSAALRLVVYLKSGLQKTAYEQLLEIEPQLVHNPERFTLSDIKLFYNYLFYLPYLRDNVEANSNLCKAIGETLIKKYLGDPSSLILNRATKVKSAASQPLRIGVISRHFHRHSVGWCSLDVIRELSKLTPSLYIYHANDDFRKDDLTEEFQKTTPNFYMWSEEYPNRVFEDSVLLEQLIFDQLDVIVDLDSLMYWKQASILCSQPAQICVSWLGCEAPFLSSHNYYLGDWNTHPAGVELLYTEKLLRMPNAHIAIGGFNAKFSDRETLRKSLQLDSNQIVYLCVATGHKLNADLIKAQISVLQQVSNSALLYKGAVGDLLSIKAMYYQECEVQGVSSDRLRFLDRTPTEEEHRSIYQAVDILLDTYPYNGGTHNLETLWFNVPLVTRVGEQGPSRMGYSFLKAVGIEEGIAHNWEEYISWGVRLGVDASLRENIRSRLVQSKQPESLSPLWNPKQFAMDMYLLLEEEGGRSGGVGEWGSGGEQRDLDGGEIVFLEKLAADVKNLSSQYLRERSDENILAALRKCRFDFIQYLLKLPSQEMRGFLFTLVGSIHSQLLGSEINSTELTQAESESLAKLSNLIQSEPNSPHVTTYVLACMLYCRAGELSILRNVSLTDIDRWILKYYVKYLFSASYIFEKPGQVEKYAEHICYWVNCIHTNLLNNPQCEVWRKIAAIFLKNRNFLQLYFSSINMKDVCSQSADIREFILENRGLQLNYTPAKKDVALSKIRLGILSPDFRPRTETFATLPVFENLDQSQFEVFLYAFYSTGTTFEQYCQKCSQKFTLLPSTIKQQAELIRSDNLDILFFGGTLISGTDTFTSLAHHRLARVQVTSICSPCTTGIRNIDYYIAGKYTASVDTCQSEYREKLLNVPGSGICFSYPNTEVKSQIKISRSDLGISSKKVVFISGANSFKIIPELREAWAKIISAVPNSVLLLYPFNPNWSVAYPEAYLQEQMYTVFAKQNVESDRLIFLPALPNPWDIPEYLKLGDVYLDSFPYGGATSLVDALKMNLPCVVFEGNTLRFRQASALLRELEEPDLITTSVDAYINLAVTLGTNHDRRAQKRKEIKRKMEGNPNFLNSTAYSAQMQALFRELSRNTGEWGVGSGGRGGRSVFSFIGGGAPTILSAFICVPSGKTPLGRLHLRFLKS